MRVFDGNGYLFGRVNLIDGVAAAIMLLLIPLGYATYLLFKPAEPRIDSVETSVITREEQRVSAGSRLVAKFKVRGSGFTPLLRARIDEADALAFVFESPTSADVLVGPVPPGPHDLVLLDGVQEVARKADAITIQPATSTSVRAAGWITDLDAETAAAIRVGTALPDNKPAYRILALGPLVQGHRRISLAGSSVIIPAPDRQARRAVITLECDAAMLDNPCTLGERPDTRTPPVNVALPGPQRPFNFAVEELLPMTPPSKAVLRVRLNPGQPAVVRTGDRDDVLDERAAVVSSVNGDIITLQAGVDRDVAGWRYRGQPLMPGKPFVMTTDRYEITGTLQSADVGAPQ